MASATSGARRFDALMLYGVLYLVFLYLPIFLIPLFSFNDSIYVAFPITDFTTKWYGEMLEEAALIQSFFNSVKVAAVVSVLATIFGTLAAKAVTRYNLKARGPIIAFIMIPFVIPGIILGISLLVLVNKLGLELSLYTIGVGHLLIAIPFSMMVILASFMIKSFSKCPLAIEYPIRRASSVRRRRASVSVMMRDLGVVPRLP